MPDPYAPPLEIVPCCMHLRTKMHSCLLEAQRRGPGYVPVSTTATYWCEQTSVSFGPDRAASTPESCQPGRTCYERES